jgi:hypothetical protein
MTRYVWVVEMWNLHRKRWEPCATAALCKNDAGGLVRDWTYKCPGVKFQARKYVVEKDK